METNKNYSNIISIIIAGIISFFIGNEKNNSYYVYDVLETNKYYAYNVITRDTFLLEPLRITLIDSSIECYNDTILVWLKSKIENSTHAFYPVKKENKYYVKFSESLEYEILYNGYGKLKDRKKTNIKFQEAEIFALENQKGMWACQQKTPS